MKVVPLRETAPLLGLAKGPQSTATREKYNNCMDLWDLALDYSLRNTSLSQDYLTMWYCSYDCTVVEMKSTVHWLDICVRLSQSVTTRSLHCSCTLPAIGRLWTRRSPLHSLDHSARHNQQLNGLWSSQLHALQSYSTLDNVINKIKGRYSCMPMSSTIVDVLWCTVPKKNYDRQWHGYKTTSQPVSAWGHVGEQRSGKYKP